MKELKEFAKKLNGVEYMEIPQELLDYAKTKGIVIVSGASDDLCELEGAIREEFGCYDGGTGYIDEDGNVCNKLDPNKTYRRITAIWCGEGEDGFTWTYNTDIPHEDFEMLDGEEKYCRGFVFYLKDLKSRNGEFLKLVRDNPDLPIVPMVDSEIVAEDGYAWWLGSFGCASVGEYVCFNMHGENRFYTRDEQCEIEEYIADEIYEDALVEPCEGIEKLAHERAEALPWVKAILVRIGLPEV